jgi:hypothetical protein
MEAMVAMNNTATRGCKGNGQSELARAIPTSFSFGEKSFSNNTFWRLNYFYAYSLFYIF